MNGKTSLKHSWGSPGHKDILVKIRSLLLPGINMLQDKIGRVISHTETQLIADEVYSAYKTGGTIAALERWRHIQRRLVGNAAIGNAIARVR